MQIISDERLLSLTEKDLQIKEYNVFSYFMRVELNCGLYAYMMGHNYCKGEFYGRRNFWFRGNIESLIVVEQPNKESLAQDEEYDFVPNFLQNYVGTNKLSETDAKYHKIEEIAKNIVKSTRAEIYFPELHDYVMETKRQIKEDFTKTLAANSSSIRTAIERVKKRQAERVKNEHDKSNPQESVLQKSSKEELSGQNEF